GCDRRSRRDWRRAACESAATSPLAGHDAHGLGDDPHHDLVGAAADRAQAGVAPEAVDVGLLDVAHAAPELHAPVRDLARDAGILELAHRRELGHVLAGDIEFGGA